MKIRLAYIEDNPSDIELLRANLSAGNLDIDLQVTDQLEELGSILNNGVDVVISDFNLRGFDGMDVLDFVRSKNEDIPFIFLSSTLGEEKAVSLIKAGATDFVLKENLQNIHHAVARAHKEYLMFNEHREFKDEIEEKNSMFTTLLNSQADLVMILKLDGEIIHANEAVSTYFKTSNSNIIGKKESEFFDQPEVMTVNRQVIEKSIPSSYILESLDPSGTRNIFEVLKSPLKVGGKNKGIVSVLRNNTQNKLLEEERSRYNQILIQAEKQAQLGSFELDIENDIISLSTNLIGLLNLKSDTNIISLNKLIDKIHPDEKSLFKEKFDAFIEYGIDFEMEHRYLPNDTTEENRYSKTVIKRYTFNGDNVHYGTMHDITEERLACMAVLNIQQKERERISRDLHDNLGQKLSACSIFMNLEDFDRKKVKHLIDESLSDVRSIARVLNTSILENGSISDAFSYLIDNLPNNEIIEFQSSLDGDKVKKHIWGQLYRIIQELLNNALKYSEATRIKISLDQVDHLLSMNYEDNGVGFELKTTSLGNGIRNMKERTRYCNGQFFLDSRVGEGTTIKIKIPLQ